MADHSSAAVTDPPRSHAARLEPDAIGVAQDTVIGMASSAPAATVGLSLAALAVATAYGSGPILILTAIPMLIIANSYRRLNLWNANCGASFEWVGRASYRVLPQFLANVSRRFATPVAASIIVGLLIIGLSSVYFLATSVQNAFTDVVD